MSTGGHDPETGEQWVLAGDGDSVEATTLDARPAGRRWKKVGVVTALAVGIPAMLAVMTFGVLYARSRLPAAAPLPEDTRLFDRDGRLLATLAGEEDREIIPFARIPAHLRNAVIATEDADFYDHPGVDVTSTVRAAIANIRSGEFSQGGSTITQQLVKNLYVGSDPTLSRKVNEAVLALKLEREMTKDQILAKYLNTVYFGHGAYGVQAAARAYFDRDVEDLSVVQSALLAGLLAAPSHWDPLERPAAAAKRRAFVLERMAAEGYLSGRRARRLARSELSVVERQDSWTDDGAAYFVDHVQRWLEGRYGSERTFAGGLRVTTTIDRAWQDAAEAAVDRSLSGGGPQGALIAIEPATGAIRALVGGRDFERTKFNLATQARRQPGSSFKPVTLIAAIEAGVSPLERFHGPPRIQIRGEPCADPGAPWTVENYADASAGTMDLFGATANSVNTIYAQLVQHTGPDAVADAAERLGVRSDLDAVCAIALGSEEVTPLELTSAYATLAANGMHREPTPVERVLDRDGTELAAIDPTGTQVVGAAEAAVVTRALELVVTSGTGTAAALPDRPVAGKTGTAQDYTNAWFCGYIPQLAACVWVGFPDGNRPMDGMTGGSVPAEIWRDFMAEATQGLEVQEFPRVDLSAFRETPAPQPRETPRQSPSPAPTITVTVRPSPTASATLEDDPSPSPSPTRHDDGPRGSPSPSPTPRGSPTSHPGAGPGG